MLHHDVARSWSIIAAATPIARACDASGVAVLFVGVRMIAERNRISI